MIDRGMNLSTIRAGGAPVNQNNPEQLCTVSHPATILPPIPTSSQLQKSHFGFNEMDPQERERGYLL